MMRLRSALITLILLGGMAVSGRPEEAQQAGRVVTITEVGQDTNNRPLYNVFADGADIADVLKALFAKAGEQYAIGPDVAGSVDLRIEKATIDAAVKRIAEMVTPPLRISHDQLGYHVKRDTQMPTVDQSVVVPRNAIPQLGPGNQGQGLGGFGGQAGTIAPNVVNSIPSDRFVSLDVPKTKPVPLSTVVAQISSQSGIPITLDRRISRDVLFYGHFSQSSLPLALQAIANAARLKIVMGGQQVYLVPGDELTVLLNNGQVPVPFGQYPALACPRCGQAVLSGWSYCPRCGQPLSAGQNNTFRNNRGGQQGGQQGGQRFPR